MERVCEQKSIQANTLELPDLESKLEDLRNLIVPGRSTFHVFEFRGRRILYDLAAGRTLEVDDAAFALLNGIEHKTSGPEILAILAEVLPNLIAIEILLVEVSSLYEMGFFRLEPLDDSRKRDEVIESLLEHHPNKLMLMIQTSCNLKCHYCYEVQSGFHDTGKKMTFEQAQESVEHMIRRAGPRKDLEVTFFGGEPLLNFSVMRQVVEYCEQRGQELGKRFSYLITTNATLLSEEIVEFLVLWKFGVMLSIDGPPEENDKHRVDFSGRGRGKESIRNARLLLTAQRKAKIRTAKVRATMTMENRDPRKLAQYFASQGFTRMSLGASHGTAYHKMPWDIVGAAGKEVGDSYEAMMDDFLQALEEKRPLPAGQPFTQIVKMVHEALSHPRERAQIRCGVARNMQAITEQGKIYPCHRYAGMSAYELGDLKSGLESNRVESYYRQILDGYDKHCSSCWARFYCGGQCPWYLSQPNGKLTTPDEDSCDGIRRGEERAIWLYHELRERFPEFLERILCGEPS